MPRESPKNTVEDFRKIYLFLYNLSQFIGFLYIIIVLSIEYIKDGPESMERAFYTVGSAVKFCGMMQLLEILHPLLGYTSGSPLMPSIQVLGRLFFIFGMIQAEPRMQTKPVVFYLIYTYSFIEIIRYPYYMLRVYNVDVSSVTWLRYTAWIPFYPIGFVCEGCIVLRNIPYFEETKKFSVFLPNAWNFSFYFPTLMRLYLLFGLFPVLYFMMSYMYKQRKKILDDESRYEQSRKVY